VWSRTSCRSEKSRKVLPSFRRSYRLRRIAAPTPPGFSGEVLHRISGCCRLVYLGSVLPAKRCGCRSLITASSAGVAPRLLPNTNLLLPKLRIIHPHPSSSSPFPFPITSHFRRLQQLEVELVQEQKVLELYSDSCLTP